MALSLMLMSGVRASPADQQARLDDPAWRAQRLDEAHARAMDARARNDIAACQAIGPEYQAVTQRDWSRRSYHIWSGQTSCNLMPGGAWSINPPTAEQVRAAWAPAMAHFARMPEALRVKDNVEVDVLMTYWNSLQQLGHSEVAASERLAKVQGWLDRVAAQPGDTVALSALKQLGRALYGQRWNAVWMAQLQEQLASALGPGHEASLHIMRARIFAYRQFEQPAQALALSDEYARLAAEFQPQDERLAMLNRSERIGALAGVGRYADALDEGQLLLGWLQRQQPRPYGNIMRTAYNLVAAAMEMGDVDAAVAFARLSVEQGRLADNSADRLESKFAELLLNQARAARGDEGAWQDLKADVRAVFSWDLPAVESVHQLLKSARQDGDKATAQWARDLIDQVVTGASVPMQAARALPRVLAAQDAPAGSDEGLEHASQALALGLAQPRPQGHVTPFFALARHVATSRPQGAIWLCKRGAQSLLQMRKGLPDDVPGLPQAWQREHDADLRACIGRLIDAGRLTEAEQAIRVLREEELYEFTRRSRGTAARREAVATLSWTEQERQRDAALQPLVDTLREQAAAARARAEAHSVPARRMGGNDEQANAVLRQAARQLREQALSDHAADRVQSPAAREAPPRAPLPAGHARLVYWLGEQRAEVLVQVGSRQMRVPLAHGSLAINRAVQAFRAELLRPGEQVPPQAQVLHGWLVAPVLPLLRGVRTLTLVPDGALRYLPFAALHDGRQYLAERYVLGIGLVHQPAPGLARGAQQGRPRLAAFGRSLPDAQHAALPGVHEELAAIARLRGVAVSHVQDAQFTRTALRRALSDNPDVVHLASHFVLDAAGEESSYLLLGDGERMPLRELRQLPWGRVRLALLSACDSGVALPQDAASQGREWAGFAAALQAAGVPNVLATLWRIEDNSTAQWVRLFYQPWRHTGTSALPDAARLAATQRAWLKQHKGTALAHPYHWAGFQWLGSTL